MRMAGPGGEQAGQRGDVDDLLVLRGVVVDLLVRSRRQETGERMDDRQQSAKGHATGLRDHVLLRDAAFEEAVGKPSAKRDDPAVEDEIGIERHQRRDALALLDEGGGIGRYQSLGTLRWSRPLVGDLLRSKRRGTRL